ncbi:SMI1/KNR4 family protein [Kitasatospora acidiphila]|uniref:SMI1/KNR4 family protein n=1 Tax=Kitasatospora acidiphila TaxID=2567942 RepID=A0A540W6R2_9ACTN|nr:SMI1/KNR4 family protein [Kitasatospora acidiphila]TQF04700.1 SMI1/KNR4 family protein [Kitasatospora acidiphila]
MTLTDDRGFPAALAAALAVPFEDDEHSWVDFEPYPAFEAAEDTAWWFRLWTGNKEVDGGQFRVFGMNGAGGYAAFWLVRPGRPVTEQPVVFLGSEGETGVVARDLGDLLWLLAGGYGPAEAACPDPSGDWTPRANPEITAIAERFAPDRRRSPEAVIEAAAREFPDFEDTVSELCR